MSLIFDCFKRSCQHLSVLDSPLFVRFIQEPIDLFSSFLLDVRLASINQS